MLYIHRDGEDSIMFGRYLEALATFLDRLPSHIAEFAGDEDRFTLSHPKSLHDAGLRQLAIQEVPGNPDAASSVDMELLLIGQQGDRNIRLRYHNVARYNVRGVRERLGWHDSFHGDIYTHEVRLGDDGRFVHEILFASGSLIEIECSDFRVTDETITPTPQ